MLNLLNWLEITENEVIIKVRGYPEKRVWKRLDCEEGLNVTVSIDGVIMFDNEVESTYKMLIFL